MGQRPDEDDCVFTKQSFQIESSIYEYRIIYQRPRRSLYPLRNDMQEMVEKPKGVAPLWYSFRRTLKILLRRRYVLRVETAFYQLFQPAI